MYQLNQDESTIMHIIMHTKIEKLPLFRHIINSVSFICKINLHVIQENQTLVLPLFLHFGGYVYTSNSKNLIMWDYGESIYMCIIFHITMYNLM